MLPNAGVVGSNPTRVLCWFFQQDLKYEYAVLITYQCNGKKYNIKDVTIVTHVSNKILNNGISLSFQGKNFKAASKQGDPPRLVVLSDMNDDLYTSGFILADGKVIECFPQDDLLAMILLLVFTYYVWDLSYPKQYQILGFIQEYVFKDSENKFLKSTNFKNLEKKYEIVVAQQIETEQ